jgi:hypothetical protein
MLTPVIQYTLNFTSDGISNSVAVDISVAPFLQNFQGNQPLAVLSPVVVGLGQVIAGVEAELDGTTVTVTFPNPPAQYDSNQNLIVYTATFYLQYGE